MPPRGHQNQRGNRGRWSPRGGNGQSRGGRGGIGMLRLGASPLSGLGGGSPYRRLEDEFNYLPLYGPQAGANGSPLSRGNAPYRGRGRVRGDLSSGNSTPPRGRGRGRGRGADSGNATPNRRGLGNRSGAPGIVHNQNAPLSRLLDYGRPFLKPIKFVKAKETPILFQEEEEILQGAEDVLDDKSHVPTAERVARVFSGQGVPQSFGSDGSSDSEDEEKTVKDETISVDFNSLAEFLASNTVDDKAPILSDGEEVGQSTPDVIIQEISEVLTSAALELEPHEVSIAHVDESVIPPSETVDDATPTFLIDVNPSPVIDSGWGSIVTDQIIDHPPLGSVKVRQELEEDDVIIYEAPNPRSGSSHATPSISTRNLSPAPSLASHQPPLGLTSVPVASTSIHELSTVRFKSIATSTSQIRQIRHSMQGASPLSSKRITKRERKKMRKRMERQGAFGFGVLGAINEESRLHEGESSVGPDPRKHEQRRGDSDLDWGDDSDENERPSIRRGHNDVDVDELSSGIGAMELDPDVTMDDTEALKRFVQAMVDGQGNHTTIADLQDVEKMTLEDEDEDEDATSATEGSLSEGESKDDEVIFQTEESALIGEAEVDEGEAEDSGEDSDSSNEDITPRRGFQARLTKIRQTEDKGKGKASARIDDDASSEDDEIFDHDFTWADDDEDYISMIQDIVDQNADLFSGGRKQKKDLFRAIRDGDFNELHNAGPAKKRKDKDIPVELRDQWERDRAKKAANKEKRTQARLETAASPFAQHKGGKKGIKDMLKASRLDSAASLPNRVTDLVSVVEHIRVFLRDIGGRNTMSLPPMARQMRKEVHLLALAFGLKSLSVGAGKARYTSLIKTSRSGVAINESKIAGVLKRNGFDRPYDASARGNHGTIPKHREGDIVGKAAPKIGESNIGFQMLAAMGWADGDRIGVSGGLDAPLTAIIKNTKLGLGATR